MDRLKTAALGAAFAALASPALATGWTVQKSEPDPFAPSGTSTFIAMELGERSGLSIRCREGKISLLLVVQATGAAQGDQADVKLIADAKGVLDDDDAEVISTSPLIIGVQFGDENTLDYLKGAQKLSLRYELPSFSSTVSFGGGKSLDDVIQKAMKACGKSSLIEPPPPVSTAAEPGSPEWKRASDACPRPYNFVVDKNDKWTCLNDQSGVPVRETAPLPAPPRGGKDCSGIPMEKRTLDCAPQYPSWARRPDVSPEAKASILARARWEITHGTPRWQVEAHLRQLGIDPGDELPPPVGPERCQWAMAHGFIFDGDAAGCLPDQHLK